MECVQGALKNSFIPNNYQQHSLSDDFSPVNVLPSDDFFVDGLLDFSDEGDFEEEKEDTNVVSDTVTDKPIFVAPVVTENNDCFTIPVDDVADLEWVSQFVDDSFSSGYSLTCPAGKFPEKKPEPKPEPETGLFVKPSFTTPVQTKATMIFGYCYGGRSLRVEPMATLELVNCSKPQEGNNTVLIGHDKEDRMLIYVTSTRSPPQWRGPQWKISWTNASRNVLKSSRAKSKVVIQSYGSCCNGIVSSIDLSQEETKSMLSSCSCTVKAVELSFFLCVTSRWCLFIRTVQALWQRLSETTFTEGSEHAKSKPKLIEIIKCKSDDMLAMVSSNCPIPSSSLQASRHTPCSEPIPGGDKGPSASLLAQKYRTRPTSVSSVPTLNLQFLFHTLRWGDNVKRAVIKLMNQSTNLCNLQKDEFRDLFYVARTSMKPLSSRYSMNGTLFSGHLEQCTQNTWRPGIVPDSLRISRDAEAITYNFGSEFEIIGQLHHMTAKQDRLISASRRRTLSLALADESDCPDISMSTIDHEGDIPASRRNFDRNPPPHQQNLNNICGGRKSWVAQLNEATGKEQLPLPSWTNTVERLARDEYTVSSLGFLALTSLVGGAYNHMRVCCLVLGIAERECVPPLIYVERHTTRQEVFLLSEEVAQELCLVKSWKNFTTCVRCLKTPSKFVNSLTFWGIEFMGLRSRLHGEQYILVAVDYLSKWVEANKRFPTYVDTISLQIYEISLRPDLRMSGVYFAPSLRSELSSPQLNTIVGMWSINRWLGKESLIGTIGENRAPGRNKLDDALWAVAQLTKTPIGFGVCRDISLEEMVLGSGYQQKGRKPSQNDKTEHGMEITVQNQGQSPKMTKSESILKNQQSLKTGAGKKLKNTIGCLYLTHLMGLGRKANRYNYEDL
ncbi:GATA transcription factor 5-like protein [Tanacetum coccineum]